MVEDGEDVVEEVDQLLRIRASRDDDVEAVDLGHRQGGALLYLSPGSRVVETRSVAPSNVLPFSVNGTKISKDPKPGQSFIKFYFQPDTYDVLKWQ